jgi:hypothetical protein
MLFVVVCHSLDGFESNIGLRDVIAGATKNDRYPLFAGNAQKSYICPFTR